MTEAVDNEGALGQAARGSIALGGAQLGSRVFSIVFVAAATRILAPSEFARYSVATAVVVAGTVLADCGTSAMALRIASHREPDRQALRAILLLSAATGSVMGALAAGLTSTLHRDPGAQIDLLIAALAIPLASVGSTALAIIDGSGRMTRRASYSLAQAVIVSAGGLAALALGLGARGAILALVAGPAVALTASLIDVRAVAFDRRSPVSLTQLRTVLSEVAPLAMIGLISAASLRFDVLALSFLSEPRETASYDIALRAGEAIAGTVAFLSSPTIFLLRRSLAGGNPLAAQRIFNRVVRLTYLLSLPLAALGLALHREATGTLLGPQFADVATPLAILLASFPLLLVGQAHGALLQAGARLWRGAALAGAVTALYIVLDLVLIPSRGAVGAAAASMAISLVTVIAFTALHRRTMSIRTPLPSPQMALAAAAAGGSAWASAHVLHDLWLPALAGMTVWGLVTAATGEGRDELRVVLSALRRR